MKNALTAGLLVLSLCNISFAQAPATQPLVSSSSITLQLKDTFPDEAYQKLADEAHLSLDQYSPQAWKGNEGLKITAVFDHASFWTVFTSLAEQTSSAPSWWENGIIGLLHDDGSWTHQPAVIIGPLRVAVQSALTRNTLLIAHTPVQQKTLSLLLDFANEPNSPVVYLTNIKVAAAVDRGGKLIAVELPPRTDYLEMKRGHSGLELKLSPNGADASAIGLLKLSFRAAVAELQTVEVPDIQQASNLTREVGDAKLTISFRQQGNGAFSVELLANSKSGNLGSWATLGRAINDSNVRLVDSAGNAIQSNGGGGGVGPRSLTRNLNFRPPAGLTGPPQKLIWNVPVSLKEVPVTVEFKDLPLP